MLKKLDAMDEIYLKNEIPDIREIKVDISTIGSSKQVLSPIVKRKRHTSISKEGINDRKNNQKNKNHKEKCYFEGKMPSSQLSYIQAK